MLGLAAMAKMAVMVAVGVLVGNVVEKCSHTKKSPE